MAPVTPPKRNSYVVKTSPISPPEQSSKRTRREHFDTASERHCLQNSYGHLQAYCCSYTFQRTTTYVQSSFQRNLWPASSDVHTNFRRKSSKEITVEPSKHKDVSPKTNEPSKHKDVSPQTVEPSKHKETVIPTEVEYDKVSKENQCLDIVSKNILQESSIKAHEAQQEQKEANISQMISEPLEDSDLNEESLLLDPSLLGFGSEDSSLDIPPELETCDQIEDPHNSLCIPQTAECQLVKGPMNEDLTVSQSDSQQTDVPEFDQISTLFDPNVPNSNGNKNDNDSAYFSTSPSINSNEDIDWQELYDNILSLN
nr:heat shock protein [Biomphalaria glabrata]